MLPKKERLSKKAFKEQRKYSLFRGVFFDCKYNLGESFKTAVVLPAKITKRAVERNRIRRMYYDIIGTLRDQPGIYIVYPKKESFSTHKEDIKKELQTIVQKK